EPHAEFVANVARPHRRIAEAETAAGDIGLTEACGGELLRLHGGVRRDAKPRQHREAVPAFKPGPVALSLEATGELIAEGCASRGEPVVGEGHRTRNIGRPRMGDAVAAELEGVA